MSPAARRKPVFDVGFWGARGSISTPGRITEKYGGNTPCVSVTRGSTVIILDAGTGIRRLGLELAREYRDRADELRVHLFLSHTHWDHIQGIPFFDPAYMSGVHLTIYGSPTKSGFLGDILRGQMGNEYFPVTMSDMLAKLTIKELDSPTLEFGDVTLEWEEQIYHPGGSLRYRISSGGTQVVYASDVELNKVFIEDATQQQLDHQKAYLDFVHGADLLVGDGQYTDEEYPNVTGYGHTTIEKLVAVAHQAEVRRLAVFHHDPQHTDTRIDELWQEYHSRYRRSEPPMQIFWAREGQILPI